MTIGNRVLSLALAATVVLGAGMAMAEPMRGMKEGQAARQAERQAKQEALYKELGLSDAQKAKMKANREAYKTENKEALEGLRAKRAELKEIVKTEGKDSPKVTALRNEMKQERLALRAKMETMHKSVLTPEQYSRLQSMKAEHRAKMQQRMMNRKGAMPQPAD
ncbi:MAG: Spy/CpxP family protein refolding chaperone [Candidatus Melainabacteria bacterium]